MRAFREKDAQSYHELSFTNAAGYWVSVARAAMEIVVEKTVDIAAGDDEGKEKQEVRMQQVMRIMVWANRMAEGFLALRVAYLDMRRERGISEANYMMGRFMENVKFPVHGLWGGIAKDTKKETELAMRKAHARHAAERPFKKRGSGEDEGHKRDPSSGASEYA